MRYCCIAMMTLLQYPLPPLPGTNQTPSAILRNSSACAAATHRSTSSNKAQIHGATAARRALFSEPMRVSSREATLLPGLLRLLRDHHAGDLVVGRSRND